VPEPQQIVDAFHAYADALGRDDAGAAAALFAPDAVVRDPIDAPPYEGVDAIHAFLAGGSGIIKSFTVTGPVRVAADGRHGAAAMTVVLDFGDGTKTLDSIDVMTFDDDGRVTAMDAYYGPTNINEA
jgi:steroid Delta-isomerase